MTDIYDRAALQEEQDRARALCEQHRRAGLTGKTVADSAEDCTECGEAIPLKRRAAAPGCQFCVTCQTQRETEFYQR